MSLQWSEFSTPALATLSDSFTTIHGIFSSDTRKKYKKATRSDITNGTKGAILKMTSFEIVIGYVKAESPELSLYILDASVVGCEGSSIFGNPCEILRRQDLAELARRCSTEWNNRRHGGILQPNQGRVADGESDTHFSARSQADT